MSPLRSHVGQGGIAALLTATLVLGACTDGDVSFTPSAGAASGGGSAQGGAESAGGSAAGTSGSKSGGASSGSATTPAGGQGEGGGDEGSSGEGGSGGDGGAAGASSSGGMNNAGGGAGSGGGGRGGAGSGGGGEAGGDGGKGGGGPQCTPEAERCDGLDNDCDDVADQDGTCPNGCTGATYGGHRYVFCNALGTAKAASERCADQDLSLVQIQDEAENAFIASNQKGSSWMGASDDVAEHHWYWYPSELEFWSDGPVAGVFSNWASGQPAKGAQGKQENCAVISGSAATSGQWLDVSCSAISYRTACEGRAAGD